MTKWLIYCRISQADLDAEGHRSTPGVQTQEKEPILEAIERAIALSMPSQSDIIAAVELGARHSISTGLLVLRSRCTAATMRYLVRSLIGRTGWTICSFAVTLMCVLGVVSCGDTATRSSVGTTTSIVETGTPVATIPPPSSTDATESAEQRCTNFAPGDQPVFFRAETVTINDIRDIVVATPPPTPTSLLLPEHAASEKALMCWSTSADRVSVAQFWVTVSGDSRVYCTVRFLEAVTPEKVGDGVLCP